MPGFEFGTLQSGWPEKPGRGTWLWIWHADKIPPHIGISSADDYFSLTYKTCELAKSVAEMMHKAERAKIPLVLVDLQHCGLTTDFYAIFEQYDRAESNKATCLTPIRAIFGMNDTVRQLSDLLTEIEKSGHLRDVFVLHLEPTYRGIRDYSITEIMQRIEQLHEANRQKSTTSSR